jgi:hypothetical protein
MDKLLMLQPIRVYKRWPMPDDFTGLVLGSPTLAFAQMWTDARPASADRNGRARDCHTRRSAPWRSLGAVQRLRVTRLPL